MRSNRRNMAIIALVVVAAIGGAVGWHSAKHERPVVCAQTEDSQLVDCRTGTPLDFHDGGWWKR